jgi:hypothetical protein
MRDPVDPRPRNAPQYARTLLEIERHRSHAFVSLGTLPFRILLLPFTLYRRLRQKRGSDRELILFVDGSVHRGTTSVEKITNDWIEAHPHEVVSTSFHKVHGKRSKQIKQLLVKNGIFVEESR